MAAPMKNGKESIKSKKYDILKEASYTEREKFALTSDQANYLSANGLAHRFIQEKQYLLANNFHRTGWRIVADPDFPGANADGVVKIGDLVLAVKTKEAQDAHKKALKKKSDRYSNQKEVNKKAAEELRQKASDAGLSAQIHEGFEENNPDKDND